MNNNKTSLGELFISFAKVGAFTFGGGYAMLPLLEREICTKHSWLSENELLDFYSIAQTTPGVIAVNTATFVGFKKRGMVGAIVATVGVVIPSVVIITLLASLLLSNQDSPKAHSILVGVNISVAALLVSAVIRLGKRAIFTTSTLLIAVSAFLATTIFNISTLVVIPLAALIGTVLHRSQEENNG